MNPKEKKKQKNTKLDAQHKFQIHKKIYLYGPFHLYYVKKNTPIESDPKKNKGNLLITEFTSFSKQLQIVKIVSKTNKACHAFWTYSDKVGDPCNKSPMDATH